VTDSSVGARSVSEGLCINPRSRFGPGLRRPHFPAFAAAYLASTAFQFTTFHHASM
jgi:hypothetical protein